MKDVVMRMEMETIYHLFLLCFFVCVVVRIIEVHKGPSPCTRAARGECARIESSCTDEVMLRIERSIFAVCLSSMKAMYFIIA